MATKVARQLLEKGMVHMDISAL